jgi:hypothetical protein
MWRGSNEDRSRQSHLQMNHTSEVEFFQIEAIVSKMLCLDAVSCSLVHRFLQNIGTYVPNYTLPRSPPWRIKISFNSLQLLCCTHQSGNKLAVTQCITLHNLHWGLYVSKWEQNHIMPPAQSLTRWNDQRFHISWNRMQCNIYRVFCLISKFLIAWMLIS